MSALAIPDPAITKNTKPDSSSPEISIVMAAFNEEQDIGEALESILAQTFTDWVDQLFH